MESYLTGRTDIVVMWDPESERECVLFSVGKDVVPVIGGVHASSLYITDLQASFVLSLNDHDFLIAFGTASEWLQGRLANSPQDD